MADTSYMANGDQHEKCLNCGRRIKGVAKVAHTRDGQWGYVGGDCFKKIEEAGKLGYPSKGGPKLFTSANKPVE